MHTGLKPRLPDTLGCIDRPSIGSTWRMATAAIAFGVLAYSDASFVFAGSSETPPRDIVVASWNVAEPRAVQALAQPLGEGSKPAWRTTFGSERRTVVKEDKAMLPVADADIVLLQGVTNLRALRRVFPARAWRIIVSRVILDPAAEVAAPAVAIRSRLDLRVTAQDQAIGAAPDDSGQQSDPSDDAWAIGIRITVDAKPIWIVSIQKNHDCTSMAPKCAMAETFGRWREQRQEAGELVVFGGAHENSFAQALPPPPCAGQRISAHMGATEEAPRLASAADDPVIGCFARLELQR